MNTLENHQETLNRLTAVTDKWTPRILFGVMGAAFLLSYVALFQKAMAAGFHWTLALLWPAMLDGVVIAALLSFIKRELRGDSTRYPFWLLVIFDGASIVLNASYGADLLAAIIHALPPLALVLMLKLYSNDIKDDYKRAAVVHSLESLQVQVRQSQAKIDSLIPKKESLESDIKRLQSDKRKLRRDSQNEEKRPKGASFSDETIERGRKIYAELKATWGNDRFGAELGRKLDISRRGGLALKKMFDAEAQEQATLDGPDQPETETVEGPGLDGIIDALPMDQAGKDALHRTVENFNNGKI